jgi:hypothetical protein
MVRKIIKKIGKTVSFLLLLAFLIPMIVLGIIQLPAVQNYAVMQAVGWLNKELGTEIRYTSFQISGFNRVHIKDLYVNDVYGDTLLYSSKTTVVIPVIFSLLFDKDVAQPSLKRLAVQDAKMYMRVDTSGTLNLQYIIDYILSRNKGGGSKKPIVIKEVSIVNSVYSLLIDGAAEDSTGINFGHMQLHELNAKASDLTVNGDTITMNVDKLNFREHSGFTVKRMNGYYEISSKHMLFKETTIITPYSNLFLESAKLSYSDYKDFTPDSLYDKVSLDMTIRQSLLNAYDLWYFSDFFADTRQSMNIAGIFHGSISDLKGKQVLLGWGSTSFLAGNFSINGLPDPDNTFLIFDLSELSTTTQDISKIDLPGKEVLALPDQLKSLQSLRYRGNFTGFFHDFVANGKLTTNLGSITTDLTIAPDTARQIRFSGRISTKDFQVGKLIDNEELVKDVTMDASVTGTYSEENPVVADIGGNISKLTLKGYPYQNIRINGNFSNKRFNGALNVDDPNLIMNFQGLIDMASEIREYDFHVNIIDANLYALNISDDDPEYHASFLLRAKAKGASLDDLNGEFTLLNSLFSKSNMQIQIYDFIMLINNSDAANELVVRSDILDAKVMGKYKFSELGNIFITYLNHYLPALIDLPDKALTSYASTNMDFDVRFKQTHSFFDFFFPDYLIGENAEAHGSFIPGNEKSLTLNLIAPEIRYKSNTWSDMILNIDTQDSVLSASVGSQNFNLSESLDLENFIFETDLRKNQLDFSTRWLNWDSTLYKGSIAGNAFFDKKNEETKILFRFNPSIITISDTVWKLNRFALMIDSAGFGIDHLQISKKNEFIHANGKISDLPGDTLNFEFDNFDLANLNFFLKKNDLELGGNLNGNGNLTGKSVNPLFFSALTISELVINKEPLGQCTINSLWNNRKQSLTINAEAQRGKLTMLKMNGDYYPADDGKVDFRITLDKLKTNILNPFVKEIFSDIRGFASGDLQFSGSLKKPSLSGRLFLQKNALTIDYLKTRYNFTTELEIANNNFILNNVEVYDAEGNHGVINGIIRAEQLRNLDINLGINIYNLLCLDTRETDNDMFFGTAYGTGTIKIKGEPTTLHFDIDAETGKNTRLSIPLSQETEVSEYNFVNFIREDSSDQKTGEKFREQRVDMTGMQMDFNLNVTDEAEVQIIFDPTVGDIIKGRGTGNLKLSINTLGSFDMVGEYIIEKGDYLFTLQNVINKRLKIEPGSTLRWSGDPFNADIDVTAVYRTKTTLTDLFGSAIEEGDPGRVSVDCRIFLTGLLMSPTIRYDLYLPFSEEDIRDRVNSRIHSEEELSKQFLSLLVMNRFLPSQGSDNQTSTTENYMVGVNNASEFLSNQLSNWLSQISNDFDVGVNYRPGGEITSTEVEVMLSTQFFNDRLSIDGSLDMKSNAAAMNTSNFAGDFDADYKLNQKGKIRLRAFNHSNDNIANNTSDYTQGFGIFFKEEFDSLGELGKRYWAALTGKKKKRAPEEVEEE